MRPIRSVFIMAQDLEARVGSLEASYALSPLQEGMLVESLSAQSRGVDITQVICSLAEPIEASHLEVAWQEVLQRHEVLRSSFESDRTGVPKHIPHTDLRVPFFVEDRSGQSEPEKALERLLKQERLRGFDPTAAPLMRVTLVRYGQAEHKLIWTVHHLIIDARAIAIVLKEVFDIYESLVRSEPKALAPAVPYRRFIEWLQQSDQSTSEQFWRNYLSSFTTPTALPMARPVEGERDGVGEEEISISKAATETLRTRAKENGVTLNTMLQAAWALLLSRYSGEDDVVFGAVRAGRR